MVHSKSERYPGLHPGGRPCGTEFGEGGSHTPSSISSANPPTLAGTLIPGQAILSDRTKASAMQWTWPMRGQRLLVLRRAIALVGGQAILRIFTIQLAHAAVPIDLGNHRGRGNRDAQ